MACSPICSSGLLPSTATHRTRDQCSTPVVSSCHATRCWKAGNMLRTVPLWEPPSRTSSPSRATRSQAMEETSSASVAATDEGSGGGGGCPGCGKTEKLGGCNGEGRIQGGLGSVPGFGWWPIKAFRPCPAFIEKGGRYRRLGQSLEEVAFGRKGAEDDRDISERLKGRG